MSQSLAAPRRGHQRTRLSLPLLVSYAILIVFSLFYLMPVYVLLVTGLKPLPEVNLEHMWSLPSAITLDGFQVAWAKLEPNLRNSVILVLPATMLSTIVGSINGYILSKWRFRGSEFLFGAMTLGVFMPGQMVLLPWAFILGHIGLSNTIAGLTLIHCVQGLSFTTLFCRNYYVSVPDDLIKAARIDGAGFWRIFRKIILPLSPPILIVTVIWQFTGIWNEFLYGVTFTTATQQPVTAALIGLNAAIADVPQHGVQSAAVVIAALPTLLVYLFGGKYFLRGLTAGAVK